MNKKEITPNLKKFYPEKEVETEPLTRKILTHRGMHYKCEYCGRTFLFWLEDGLEEPGDGPAHKPVPFAVGCLCGGTLEHVDWGEDICLHENREINSTMNYFENTPEYPHGVPHIRNDGYFDTDEALKDLQEYMDVFEGDIVNVLEGYSHATPRSELECFSTSELKAELRRRKGLSPSSKRPKYKKNGQWKL